MEEEKKIAIPYQGYPAGWNVIMYNDDVHSMDLVVTSLMNSNLFNEFEAEQIAMITSVKGFMTIPFNKDKLNAEILIGNLHKVGLQAELIFSEGIKKEWGK